MDWIDVSSRFGTTGTVPPDDVPPDDAPPTPIPPVVDADPALAKKPARDLTDDEALKVLGLTRASLNAAGKLDFPTKVEGVTFEYCQGTKCAPIVTRNLAPGFVVFLHRLARFLRERYGIVSIQHAGMWPAGYGQPSHDGGIAIDFDGATAGDGTVYSVLNDWGMKPKSGPGYRLQPSDKGYQFFKDIYDFTGREGDDRFNGTQTVLGQEDSFIRHPDLKNAEAAEKHKNHLHLQAGQIKTGKGVVPIQPPSDATNVATTPSGGIGATGALLVAAVGVGAIFLATRKS